MLTTADSTTSAVPLRCAVVPRAPEPIEVVEYTDPGCSWAWGSEPKLRLLRWRFGDRLRWRRVLGGLIGDMRNYLDGFDAVQAAPGFSRYWAHVAATTGMPYPAGLSWMYRSTEPACLAAKAAELQGADVAERVLRRLREATFVFGEPPDTPERIRTALRGVPALDLGTMLASSQPLPRIRPEDRLPRDQEMVVLDCVIELLLERGICLRHQGLLIFPTAFPPRHDDQAPNQATSLSYAFAGPIDKIYASLVCSLALSKAFGAMRLWEDRAEFGRAEESSCGIRKVRPAKDDRQALARLDVFFDSSTPDGTRDLFVTFVDEHLREQQIELVERLEATCECGQVFSEETVRTRIDAGHTDVGCPRCDRRTPLTGAEQSRAKDPAILERTKAIRVDTRKQRSISVAESKAMLKDAQHTVATANPIRILHLSDLHVDARNVPASLLQPLLADLRDARDGFGIEQVDYLVITGDITNRAAPAEFDAARAFVSQLIEELKLTGNRCVIVPGNHDLDWATEVYRFVPERLVNESDLKPGTFQEERTGYLLRMQDELYAERFRNFSKHFYHPLLQKEYPLAPAAQCLVHTWPESQIQVLAMNSAWEIDEYFKQRSSINHVALSDGLLEADRHLTAERTAGRIPANQSMLRLVAWHHPISGNEMMTDNAFVQRLEKAGVRACLHGHIHENRADLLNYLDPSRRIHVIGAASFGAPANDRPEAVPRGYNYFEISRDRSTMRVYTRCLQKEGGAWGAWAVWPGPNAHEKRAYYDIALT